MDGTILGMRSVQQTLKVHILHNKGRECTVLKYLLCSREDGAHCAIDEESAMF